MSDDQTVRAVLIAGVLVVLPIAVDHRLKSRATAEKLARWQEGLFIVTRLRPVGIVFMLELIAYMIRCDGLDDLGCAASTISAGWRQLFLPAKGQQRSVAHHLATLGCCRRPVGGREAQRRSADRRVGASRRAWNTGVRRTPSVRGRPVHDVGSAAGRGVALPRRFACSVRKLETSNSSSTE